MFVTFNKEMKAHFLVFKGCAVRLLHCPNMCPSSKGFRSLATWVLLSQRSVRLAVRGFADVAGVMRRLS